MLPQRFWVKIFTLPLSWLWGLVSTVRHLAFDRGWISIFRPAIPVISIGNIVAGGTGKTPLTEKLLQDLSRRLKVALLARGYRAAAEHSSWPIVLSEGTGPLLGPEIAGDEPYLLASNLPQIISIVGRKRAAAALLAECAGAQAVVLDDGMQHRFVARDFEIVVVDARDPFGGGHYLPHGLLRDHPRRLQVADLIVLNHLSEEVDQERVLQQIRQYSQAPIMGVRPDIVAVHNISPKLAKGRVALFCGLAKPRDFFQAVTTYGATPLLKKSLADHRGLSHAQLRKFAEQAAAKGAQCILCTQKDFVKLPLSDELKLPVGWVEMRLQVLFGQEHWQSLVQKILDSKVAV